MSAVRRPYQRFDAQPCAVAGAAPGIAVVRALAILLMLWPAPAIHAQPVSASAITAAFVLNFLKFVDWPGTAFSAPNAPLVLCVSGAGEELGAALLGLGGRTVQGRELVVRSSMRAGTSTCCHAVYLSGQGPAQREAIPNDLSLLTIGDAPGFAGAGGMVGLYTEDGKMRFEINARSVQRSSLTISSQLMSLARIVNELPRGE
jgi:hypothetical protein